MKTAVLLDLGNVLIRLRFERGWARMRALAAGSTPARAREAAHGVAPRDPALATRDGWAGPPAVREASSAAGMAPVPAPRTTAPVPPARALPEAAARFLSEHAEAYNRGELAPAAFLAELARALGRPDLSYEDCADAWCDIFDPWPDMEAIAADALAAGYPVYLLSNTDPVHYAYLRERVPLLDRLTGHHLSCEVRLAKPDPAYFESALARFGLDRAACAFVDDRDDNCEAAERLGIASFVHRGDPAEVRAFLRGRGVRV